jgi:hypothetical protein
LQRHLAFELIASQFRYTSSPRSFSKTSSSRRNGNLNLHPSLDIDDDLLDDLGRRVQINQPLVDPHLKHIPGLASLSAGRFACGDFEGLGRQAHRALDSEVLGFGTLEKLGAHLFQGLDFTR